MAGQLAGELLRLLVGAQASLHRHFIATCEQPGNKYDLQRIRDQKDEPLHEYVRRFSEMRIKVPSISDNEAIEAFITGLRFHDALRDKLLRKRPDSVTALLATAKKYADADDAKKIIIEEAARVPRFDHPTPRRLPWQPWLERQF